MTKKKDVNNTYTSNCVTEPIGPYIEVFKNTRSLLPLPDEDGDYYYTDKLCYLLRVMPQNGDFYKVLGLANYGVTYNGLTEKQRIYADGLLAKYERLGYFDAVSEATIEKLQNKKFREDD